MGEDLQRGAEGDPLGPIRLSAPVGRFLAEKAEGIQAATREGGGHAIPTTLALMAEMDAVLQPMIENFVAVMRSFGHPWSEIASVLGVSEQAAWERFRHLDGRVPRSVVVAEVD